ncbi:MAG: vesicle coat component, partial [Watsoniomyces obsoletus]
MVGPRRSQTQSPSKQHFQPSVPIPSNNAFARPASAHGQMSPIQAYSQIDNIPGPRANLPARGFREELEFVQPTDETQHDPLQRWKGTPVFHFGFGGTVVSTFPKHIPRYSAGAVRPQIKCGVGE